MGTSGYRQIEGQLGALVGQEATEYIPSESGELRWSRRAGGRLQLLHIVLKLRKQVHKPATAPVSGITVSVGVCHCDSTSLADSVQLRQFRPLS